MRLGVGSRQGKRVKQQTKALGTNGCRCGDRSRRTSYPTGIQAMSEAVVDDIVAVLPPLLHSLEALGFVARHLNPPDFDAVMEAAGEPDQALQAVRPRLADWPQSFAAIKTSLEAASDAALAAFAGLRAVQLGNGDLIS